MELMQANRQWSTRPSDERFTSLHALATYATHKRDNSARRVMANRGLTVLPSTVDPLDIAVSGPNGHPATFTHWSFGQLCSRAGVPASYLRDSKMPGALAADNLNWGLHHARSVEDVSVLLRKTRDDAGNVSVSLGAVNGPEYGVIWDADIAQQLVSHFGDGVTGSWRVPGEFGKRLDAVTKDNTTLYASDRDMWVFLADEDRRVDVPSRRNGKSGTLARGFYITNSEVGASRLVLGMFLFDYVCCNRIIWGAAQHQEIKIRHTSGAPHRWIEEVKPILRQYAEGSAQGVSETIAAARAAKVKGDIDTFLANRFGKGMVMSIHAAHVADEGRPIETMWDVVVGATAYARNVEHVDRRVQIERTAGDLLRLVA